MKLNPRRHTLRSYFATGLLVFIPIFVTIYVIWLSFLFLDGLLRPLVKLVVPDEIPGLNLVVTVITILALGAAVTLAAGKKVLDVFEDVLSKVPIISGVYSVVKEASSLFLVQEQGRFKSVVLIEYPRKGMYSLAFTAGIGVEAIKKKTGEEMVNVYIPSTPNPTTGFFYILPAKDVMAVDVSVDEAVRLILSGGLMDIQKKEKNKT